MSIYTHCKLCSQSLFNSFLSGKDVHVNAAQVYQEDLSPWHRDLVYGILRIPYWAHRLQCCVPSTRLNTHHSCWYTDQQTFTYTIHAGQDWTWPLHCDQYFTINFIVSFINDRATHQMFSSISPCLYRKASTCNCYMKHVFIIILMEINCIYTEVFPKHSMLLLNIYLLTLLSLYFWKSIPF